MLRCNRYQNVTLHTLAHYYLAPHPFNLSPSPCENPVSRLSPLTIRGSGPIFHSAALAPFSKPHQHPDNTNPQSSLPETGDVRGRKATHLTVWFGALVESDAFAVRRALHFSP